MKSCSGALRVVHDTLIRVISKGCEGYGYISLFVHFNMLKLDLPWYFWYLRTKH